MTMNRQPDSSSGVDPLAPPSKERVKWFSHRIVRHPRIDQVAREVCFWINTPSGNDILLVIGPTGVGKTTQQKQLENTLHGVHAEQIKRDASFIPFLRVEAPAPESSSFSWKDFYIRILTKLEEPYPANKQLPPKPMSDSVAKASRNPNMTAAVLRRAIEKAFHHRRTETLIIDEAQHLRQTGSNRRLQDHMDCLKSLSNLSGVRLILYGTYELLDLLQLNAQLARRCTELHFPRYKWVVDEDNKTFLAILKTFESRLPLETRPNLVGNAEFLYKRSAGCVGILKDWLTRALCAALDGDGVVTRKILEMTAPSHGTAQTIAEDIRNGEFRFQRLQEGGAERSLEDLLGMTGPPTVQAFSPSDESDRKLRPGQRKPKRDPVGMPS